MTLSAGKRLGVYEIGALIGVGGMGEVYQATDGKLKRQVAIKVLPDLVRNDTERMARLQREAEVLASLNHPNIAHVYGIEDADGVRALVMELVEGPTLADRIAQGPMAADEALPIASQILAALEAAHERGIVHRDLKPANIKVRDDGTVKVLDFGLAKAFEGTGPGTPLSSQSPTITTPAMTQMGVILGTAAYMSPEQAKGRPVDRRADVWAFGCVLYEMLTARRAFAGEDVSDTLANVLKMEADWQVLPASVPPRLRQVIRACLTKAPKQRIESAQDVRLALEGVFETEAPAPSHSAPAPQAPWRRGLGYVGVALVAAVSVGLSSWGNGADPVAGATRFFIDVAPNQTFRAAGRAPLALSPDGRVIAFNGAGGVMRRAMDDLEARLIPGTEAPLSVLVSSPNGEELAFYQDDAIRRIPIRGGASVVVASGLPMPRGMDWTEDGTILFAVRDGIQRVPASGGIPETVIAADGAFLNSPQMLPGGDAVLFTAGNDTEEQGIFVHSLRTGERTRLVERGSVPRYAASGHLVYHHDGSLFAVGFDVERLAVTTPIVPVVQAVASQFWEVSAAGTLVYIDTVGSEEAIAVSVGRDGAVEPLTTVPGGRTPRLSPDGRRVAIEIGADLWVYEMATGRRVRVTSTGGARSAWDPSGARLAFVKDNQVWIAPADASGEARQITKVETSAHVDAWSPDGRLVAFHRHSVSATQIYTVAVDEPGATPVLLDERVTSAESTTFSPDGRYVAYMSAASGVPEIYIRPFPGPGAAVTVSIGGGMQPVWAKSGELFYRDLEHERMLVVGVKTSPKLEVGTPRELFVSDDFVASVPGGSPRPQYDVTADGRRLLMLKKAEATGGRIVVVQHWFEELKRLVPLK